MKTIQPTICIAGLLAVLASLVVTPSGHCAERWGFVASIVGPNILLDDGALVRLTAGTRVLRADGSAGQRDDIGRGSRIVVTQAADGSVSEVRTFAPRATQLVYLSNLAPVRGAAYATTMRDTGGTFSRSLALSRVTYTRPANWTQFVADVRYDPRGAAGAPTAARFMLKDSFGDAIAERVVSAGQSAPLNAGLDANATDRLTLEVAPAAEGQVDQDWCLWLDPRFVAPSPGAPAMLSREVPARLIEALTKSLGETRIDGLAVCEFTPIRVSRDQSFLRDLGEDLLALLGRKYRVAGVYRTRLAVGAPLPDANRNELQKLGAAYVLVGSVNTRAEGTVINTMVVQVDNGALIAAASIAD
jgi:TolB-like protein